MEKNRNYSKLISLMAILITAYGQLKIIAKEWKHIYTDNVLYEIVYFFPVLFTVAIIIWLIFLIIIYISSDLKCSDSLNKDYKKSCDTRDRIYHILNLTVSVYFVVIIFNLLFYSLSDSFLDIWQTKVGNIIIIFGVILVVFMFVLLIKIRIKQEILILKKKCDIKIRMLRLPREWYIVFFLTLIIVPFLAFVVLFPPDAFSYEISSAFEKEGDVELVISTNREIKEVNISVNDKKLEHNELEGYSLVKNGTEKRYKMLDKVYFYKVNSSLIDVSSQNTINKINIEVKTVGNQMNENNDYVTLNNEFYVDENGKFIYTKEIINIGN